MWGGGFWQWINYWLATLIKVYYRVNTDVLRWPLLPLRITIDVLRDSLPLRITTDVLKWFLTFENYHWCFEMTSYLWELTLQCFEMTPYLWELTLQCFEMTTFLWELSFQCFEMTTPYHWELTLMFWDDPLPLRINTDVLRWPLTFVN